MGAKVRNLIIHLIEEGKRLELDFTNVNVVSNSFADECIAKLLIEMPLEKLKKAITFSNLTSMAERSILVTLQRRYKSQR